MAPVSMAKPQIPESAPGYSLQAEKLLGSHLSGLWLESVEEGEAISSWAARECFTEGIMPGSVLGVVRSHQCTGGEQEPPKQKKGLVVTEARRFTFRIFACAPFLSEL